jgi:hypothetical protein
MMLAALACSGCTHRQLTRNTALTATTVNSIEYRMVLDNIAMMSCEPGNLPSHVRLADGTVQISNQAGFGDAGGFSALRGTGFGFEQWGAGRIDESQRTVGHGRGRRSDSGLRATNHLSQGFGPATARRAELHHRREEIAREKCAWKIGLW